MESIYYEYVYESELQVKGIACHTLELLIEEAKNKGVEHMPLEAMDMGRLLYERYGFVSMKDEMELPEDCL